MRYDFFALSEKENHLLKTHGLSAPKWHTVSPVPRTQILTTAFGPVAVVLFPALSSGQTAPKAEMIDELNRTASSLRGKAILVAGISEWGDTAERSFLDAKPSAFDILLGSGPGPGSSGMILNQGKTLWVRAYTKGQAVALIEILDPKGRNAGKSWQLGENVRTTAEPFRENIPDRGDIAAIFAKF